MNTSFDDLASTHPAGSGHVATAGYDGSVPPDGPMDQADIDQRKLAALSEAVELLGFDPDRLARAMLQVDDGYWQGWTLLAARVEFDPGRIRALQPAISPLAEAAANTWFSGVRRQD